MGSAQAEPITPVSSKPWDFKEPLTFTTLSNTGAPVYIPIQDVLLAYSVTLTTIPLSIKFSSPKGRQWT